MSSVTNGSITIKGSDFRGSNVLVNCQVPSGQVAVEIETDIASGNFIPLVPAVVTTSSFTVSVPMEGVNIRLTSSGGATVTVPAI